jgi:hypothetical protein
VSTHDESRPDGPVEAFAFPSTLSARVVDPSDAPRIHGYDVQTDLAGRYSLAELALLAATGELPDRESGRALEVALAFLSPSSVAEAPAHTAVLARLCGATTAATLAAAALTLAEQARELVSTHLDWLAAPQAAASPGELPGVVRLRDALPPRFAALAGLTEAPSVEAAALLVLRACGATTPEALESLVVWARLPCAAAEALAVRPASFREYPMDVPRFEYENTDE